MSEQVIEEKKSLIKIILYSFILTFLSFSTFLYLSEGMSPYMTLLSIFHSLFFGLILIILTILLSLSIYGLFRAYIFGAIVIVLTLSLFLFIKGEVSLGIVYLLFDEVPIFLICPPLFYFASKKYFALKSLGNKLLGQIILLSPFILISILILIGLFTCSFDNNYQCVSQRVAVSGDYKLCHDEAYYPKIDNKRECIYRALLELQKTQEVGIDLCNEYQRDPHEGQIYRIDCYAAMAKIKNNSEYCNYTWKDYSTDACNFR